MNEPISGGSLFLSVLQLIFTLASQGYNMKGGQVTDCMHDMKHGLGIKGTFRV